MPSFRSSRRLAWIGSPAVLLILIAVFWDWNWFIPIVQSRASASIGRPVTISHLHVRLGRVVTMTADGVVIANPRWPSSDPFVTIGTLTVQADAWGYIRGHGLVLPLIRLDRPRVLVAETKDGTANFRLSSGGGSNGGSLKIGDVRISDGNAHIVDPQVKVRFEAKLGPREMARLQKSWSTQKAPTRRNRSLRIWSEGLCYHCAIQSALGLWTWI